jgi:acyl-coenzyme A synthetase/AMP-(fatty) acid ligase
MWVLDCDRSLRHVVSSGEKLHTSSALSFIQTPGLNARLWNMYGATEAGCTYFVCKKGEEHRLAAYPEGVPAGVPQSYVDAYIMATADDDPADPLRLV